MPRPLRLDVPQRWHHVMNRGLAHRPVFEHRRDRRHFLALVARAVREKRIEVHSYCLMTTHFHLLVRSLDGRLSETMRRIQNRYVRRFNRSRGRDGALFKGRFCSRHVDSLTYQFAVVAYIDSNPVRARITARAGDYPWGSACQYQRRVRGPPWLCRTWLEGAVRNYAASADYLPAEYELFFEAGEFGGLHAEVERRLEQDTDPSDELSELLRGPPAAVVEWMRRCARLADGTAAQPLIPEATSVRAVVHARTSTPAPCVLVRGQRLDVWSQIEVGMLRDLCKLTFREIAALTRSGESRTERVWRRHRRLLGSEPDYARAVARVVADLFPNGNAVVERMQKAGCCGVRHQ